MTDNNSSSDARNRRTFAIISHPDAGKTTLTEQLLLLAGAVQLAGTVKARKSDRHAASDWMALEKSRGISVTTSVMQIVHRDCVINLLDTPGHADFSEDTYRTLTAVDSSLMVIDVAKGVEDRTIKLMRICQMRDTPIMTFINKLDRFGKEPMSLVDEIEQTLGIHCAPMTWPLGMGQLLKGIYHFKQDRFYLYQPMDSDGTSYTSVDGLDNPLLDVWFSDEIQGFRDEVSLVQAAYHEFDEKKFLQGKLTPVYFGSAINHFGMHQWLDDFVEYAPLPQPRPTSSRTVEPHEKNFSGFVFKIQANMDPRHHDRVAFLRVVSGHYKGERKFFQVRLNKQVQISKVMTFVAQDRLQAEQAFPGDIIGIHNHGSISIGDTFTQGEQLQFTGIPNFAPEIFRVVELRDPLKMKALLKGLNQLSEEGATQVFRPLIGNQLILGAVGILQFDVVEYRLLHEYGVSCRFSSSSIVIARWVKCDDEAKLKEFKTKMADKLSLDHALRLTFLAPSRVNLRLTQDRWPDIQFLETCEQ